jgi:SPP1 gp7 family putative phage head morphogenesis protein
MYRLKTIYSVNMQTSYMAGRYKTQIENTGNRPYWEYIAVLDERTRPEHAELNGLVFRYDDPFWSSFYPPNGWQCRCRVNALSNYNMEPKKLKPNKSAGLLSEETCLVSKKTGEYKPVTVYTDPLTGRKVAPDIGWSYNPAK